MTESPSRASTQLTRDGRPKGGTLMPCKDSQIQQEEEVLFFTGKDSANKKPWKLCLRHPSQLPFSLNDSIFLPLPSWDLHVAGMIADPILQVSADFK